MSTIMPSCKETLASHAPVLLDRDDGHWYKTNTGNVYPSITTILSATTPAYKKDGLEDWKASEPAHHYITNKAKDIGTQLHKIMEDYLCDNLSLDAFDLLPVAHFYNLKPYLNNISNVVCVEQRMYSDTLKVAGTADLIAEYDGVLSIIDYKTKRRPQIDEYMHEYYLQTACYAQMFHEITGIDISQVVILVSSETNTRQEFIKAYDVYAEPMLQRIEKYYLNDVS